MKDRFENNIKSLLDSYETDFDPADWADMNARLDAFNSGKSNSSNRIRNLLIAASVIVVAGVAYFMLPDTKENPAVDTHTLVDAKENAEVPVQPSVEPIVKQEPVKENIVVKEIVPNHQVTIEKSQKEVSVVVPSEAKEAKEEVVSTNRNTVDPEVPKQTLQIVENTPKVISEPKDIVPVLSAAFKTSANTICEGIPVQFVPNTVGKENSYKWYFGDGETSVEANPTHVFKSKGNYTVRLRITDKFKKYDEQKSVLSVKDAPLAAIDFNIADDNRTLNFESNANRATEVRWDFGDAKSATNASPTHSYTKYGSYQVTLTAKNAAGCTIVLKKVVEVKNMVRLLAPNAFSPDGDNLNDTWIPEIKDAYSVTISIQDVNGNAVYSTSNNTPWDGTNGITGEKVKAGSVFTWTAIIEDKQGNTTKDKGSIMIK